MFLTDNGRLHKLSFITFLSQWCLILDFLLMPYAFPFSQLNKELERLPPPQIQSSLRTPALHHQQ